MRKLYILLLLALVFSSHDMYLKMDTYFLDPMSETVIKLYNGTFDKSENVIDRNRMQDVSMVSNDKRVRFDSTHWSEKDSVTLLAVETGKAGTYVAGVSTKARNIEMTGEAFNSYLEHDGVLDMLEKRKKEGKMDDPAVEKYSKHVKAIFQVGEVRTGDWQTELGYPIEFIPLVNPYEVYTGDEISVRLNWQGEPLADQLVYVDYQAPIHGHSHESGEGHSHEGGASHSHDEGHSHSHDEGEDHTHTSGLKLRTDADGVVNFTLTDDGIWFFRTIYLTESEKEGLTHESNWATLTFEVSHDHDPSHVHVEEDFFGVPSFIYWLGSFAILGILFLIFYRKKDEKK